MAAEKKKAGIKKSVRRIEIGKRGEDLAAAFLIRNGYQVLERNWRTRVGEIDLIACKDDEFRIVEVKTRVSLRGGSPLESVTDRKMQTLNDLALSYFLKKGLREPAYHLDVITIEVHPNRKATLRYLPDIQ
jgi:putative endonuclease